MPEELSPAVTDSDIVQPDLLIAKRRRWSRDDDQRLSDMLAAKVRRDDIARALGRTRAAVSNRRNELVRAGRCALDVRYGRGAKRNAKWTPEETQKLCRMIDEGKNFPAIARALHRNQTEIASVVSAMRRGSLSVPDD